MPSALLLDKRSVGLKEAAKLVGCSAGWLRQSVIHRERDFPGSIMPPHPFKKRRNGFKAFTDEFIEWYEIYSERNPRIDPEGIQPGASRSTPIFEEVDLRTYAEALRMGKKAMKVLVQGATGMRRWACFVATGKKTSPRPRLLPS
ncbi:MAG: hypothetical protein KF812_13675 [Fimbriimonadaceae bacterium]|nr:hypothetical protein [Fimbriimonadaceae bacterium]